MGDCIAIQGIQARTIIGTLPWERQVPQQLKLEVQLGLDIHQAAKQDDIAATVDYSEMTHSLVSYIEQTQCRLLEALAEQVAQWLLQRYPLQHVELDVTKPGALKQAKSVAVRIVRYAEPKQSASQ